MNAQVEIFMLDHEETCFDIKLNIFHDFRMKNVNAFQTWLVGLMESSMNEKFSSWKEACFESR